MNQQSFQRQDVRVAPKRRRFRQYLTLLASAVFLVAVMLLIVNEQRHMLELGYQVVEQGTENAKLRERQDRLKVELAKLTAPDRIIGESVRMGLRPMASTDLVEVHLKPVQSNGEAPALVARMEELR
jgi:cell division protein FtsL